MFEKLSHLQAITKGVLDSPLLSRDQKMNILTLCSLLEEMAQAIITLEGQVDSLTKELHSHG